LASSAGRRAICAIKRAGFALCLCAAGGFGTVVAAPPPARPLITAQVDAANLHRLAGNVRPEARAANDRGRVPDTLALPHLQLLLTRPAERESALQRVIQDLHDRSSMTFHRWLTSVQVGERYGLAASDLTAITGWLEARGFTINAAYPGIPLIDFSGTAGAVRNGFQTEIHFLDVGGVRHIANMSDPVIPAALAPAIAGIVSLHDFKPHAQFKRKAAHPVARPAYTTSAGYTAVVPADLATIYDLNPLFSDGISGKGQTIVVIEDSNVYSTADWSAFRAAFGLTAAYPSGTLTEEHPASGGTNNCANPGIIAGTEIEATLDAQWASAAAPSAAIVLASCADTTTFGGLIALENLVNGTNPPALVSLSYGECEAANGAAANAAFNSLYEEAVALGTSVFVAAGDAGAASCDADLSNATHGIGVSGFASSPYDVAVGGTDFGDTYAGTTNAYWSPTNSALYGSALSYVPEIPWNDSCASVLLAAAYGRLGAGYGNGTPYGANGFCNSSFGGTYFLTTAGGSGGPSGCATGAAATAAVVGGSCAGYAKPAWQSVVGNPADKVRDLPDVALFAADGVWNHYYVFCDSDTGDGGAACTGAPSGWSGAGGTSFAAPIMAGIQALVNQATGARQGNPNPTYYALAAAEYGTGGASGCNSSNGNGVSQSCAFYDITQGDIDVNCTGTLDCYLPGGTYGVLSTPGSGYARAYGTGIGWDFATGLGSINAAVLVNGWNTSDLVLTGSGKLTAAGLLSYALTVTNSGPPTATSVVLGATLPAGVSLVTGSSSAGCTQSGQTLSCAFGNVGKGGTITLTVVLNPGTASTVNLTFGVTAGNGVLFPANDQLAIPLTSAGGVQSTDGPLPPWAYGVLGAGLIAIASRRLNGRSV
jgi:uncharacterized repeat protein (TIGR01451 family)